MNKLLDVSEEITTCEKVPTEQNLIRTLELVKQGEECLIGMNSNKYSPQSIIAFLKLIEAILMTYTYKMEFDSHSALADIEKLFVNIVLSQATALRMGDKQECVNLTSVAAQCAYFDKELQANLRLLSKDLSL